MTTKPELETALSAASARIAELEGTIAELTETMADSKSRREHIDRRHKNEIDDRDKMIDQLRREVADVRSVHDHQIEQVAWLRSIVEQKLEVMPRDAFNGAAGGWR